MPDEALMLQLGVACLGAAGLAAWLGQRWRLTPAWFLGLLGLALLGFTVAIAVRWQVTGYGPFLTLYEVLLSNLFSLALICWLVYWRSPSARWGAPISLLLLLILGLWAQHVPATASQLPATYASVWLWVHVGVGKAFLGANLVAVGLAARLLLQGRVAAPLPTALRQRDRLAWSAMAVAFIFHSLMLISGAIWAQDAWGRYWAWDPLETSAFITWLALAASLHLRLTVRLSPRAGWLLIIAVFVLAVLTFLGVPFFSTGPHQGLF